MNTINDFEILCYFLLGGLFLCYFIIVFTQFRINNTLRLCVSGLFLFLGFSLMSWGGKLLSGEQISYTVIALASCFVAAVISTILVLNLYRRNKEIRRRSEIKKDKI